MNNLPENIPITWGDWFEWIIVRDDYKNQVLLHNKTMSLSQWWWKNTYKNHNHYDRYINDYPYCFIIDYITESDMVSIWLNEWSYKETITKKCDVLIDGKHKWILVSVPKVNDTDCWLAILHNVYWIKNTVLLDIARRDRLWNLSRAYKQQYTYCMWGLTVKDMTHRYWVSITYIEDSDLFKSVKEFKTKNWWKWCMFTLHDSSMPYLILSEKPIFDNMWKTSEYHWINESLVKDLNKDNYNYGWFTRTESLIDNDIILTNEATINFNNNLTNNMKNNSLQTLINQDFFTESKLEEIKSAFKYLDTLTKTNKDIIKTATDTINTAEEIMSYLDRWYQYEDPINADKWLEKFKEFKDTLEK